MQIELLKNRETNIIEKLVIPHHNNHHWKSLISLNLTHEESMVLLGKLDIKWHQIIINYHPQKNRLKIMNEAQKDFHHNRQINFLLNYFFTFHDNLAKSDDLNQQLDLWYVNYYFWTFFYIVLKAMTWNKELKLKNPLDHDYLPVFDPFILFMLEGIDYCLVNQLLSSRDQIELSFIFNMHLQTKPDDLFKQLKHYHSKDQNLNLLVFEKEVILKNEIKNQAHIFWLLKQRTIANHLLQALNNKIHYQKKFLN